MAKPPVVEPAEIERAVKIARVTGSQGMRNAALVYMLFLSAMTPAEIARLTVDDYLRADGSVRKRHIVRAEISYNGYERPFRWSNQSLVSAIDSYLAWRLENKVGRGTEGRYRGLDPHSALFQNGRTPGGFRATSYIKDGVRRESAMVISALFKTLLKKRATWPATRSVYWSGLRRHELVSVFMNKITLERGKWVLRVKGKGRKKLESVLLLSPAMNALRRYRLSRGLPELPTAAETDVPLVAAHRGKKSVTDNYLNTLLKGLFDRLAGDAAHVNAQWAKKLEAGTAHWLRHTLATTNICRWPRPLSAGRAWFRWAQQSF